MSKVIITLTDVADGIEMQMNYVDGYDKKSDAHQHARILLGQLDEMASRTQPPPEQIILSS